jgi:hypothetical protein
MVIVQVSIHCGVQETAEMIETMPIVPANGRVEGHWQFADVVRVAQLRQQCFALRERVNGGLNEFV